MATVTKGRTFTSGETVTPAKLNDVVDLATVTDIQTADIADGQVTDAKLATGIDASKLTTGTLPADRIGSDAITTARILNANVTPAKLSQPLTLDTAQATTSGTSIDFTGIPSWAKRITVMFQGVSTNGSSNYLIQLGTGSTTYTTSGYLGTSTVASTSVGSANMSGGFLLNQAAAGGAAVFHGLVTITNISSNNWVAMGYCGQSNEARGWTTGGSTSLSAVLTAVRLTTVNGTDTFDAGSVNIMYEG